MLVSSLNTLLPSFSVNILVDILEGAGLDSAPVLRAAQLARETLDDPALLVTTAQELAVERGFAAATQDRRDLWIAAGERYQLFTYYPLGFAQITAPTLADALALMQRFAVLHYGLGAFEEVDDGAGNIGVRMSYDPALAGMREFLLCKETIAFTNALHELWGGRFPFSRIETGTRLPADWGYDYRAPVRDAAQSGWFWPREIMQEKLAHADAVLHKLYVARSERIASATREAPPDRLLARLNTYFAEAAPGGWTLERAAQLLSMSRRSLQRSLAARNVSFRSLADGWRRRQAEDLLSHSSQPVAEIAWALGYADSSSFHQAFSRWTAMSPRTYRKQVRAG